MPPRIERNLQQFERWAPLYNDYGSKFVSDCYIETDRRLFPGLLLLHGRQAFPRHR